jgi:hypothetical protein
VGKIDITETIKKVERTLREDNSISPQVQALLTLLITVINLR